MFFSGCILDAKHSHYAPVAVLVVVEAFPSITFCLRAMHSNQPQSHNPLSSSLKKKPTIFNHPQTLALPCDHLLQLLEVLAQFLDLAVVEFGRFICSLDSPTR